MAKKIKKQKQDKKETIKEEPKEKPASVDGSEADNTFDFGGIPARDLKKNLGCG